MTTKKEELSLLKKLEKMTVLNDPINPDLYKKFDVKRGLRNANGTGVLVGLTRIGDVVGYEIKDGEKIAIPGKLIYRGYNVEDLIQDAEQNKLFGYEQCAYLLLFGECSTVSIEALYLVRFTGSSSNDICTSISTYSPVLSLHLQSNITP